jgi:PAS domain S-box-containing protein
LVLRSLPMAFYTAYPHDDYGAVWVSEQIERITGYTMEEMVEEPNFWASRLHSGDKERVFAVFDSLPEVGALDIEYRWRVSDGRYRWFRDYAVLVRDEDNAPKEIIGAWLDITERVRMESELRESEQRYRNIVQTSPMGMHMYELDAEDRVVFVGANPAADEILGLDNNQFIGKIIEEAFPPLGDTEVPERYRRAAAEGETWHTEQITYEDEKISGAFEVYAFQTSPGRMVALFLDVTERKMAERTLRQQADRLRILHEIDKAILEAESSEAIAHIALTRVRELIPCQRASIAALDFGEEIAIRTIAVAPSSAREILGEVYNLPAEVFDRLGSHRLGETIYIEDLHSISLPSSITQGMKTEGIKALVIVPLMLQDELIGTLNLGSATPSFFTSDHIEIAQEVADSLAISMHQARLLESEQRRRQELEILEEVSIALRSADSQEAMLPVLVEETMALFHADAGAIFVPQTGELEHAIFQEDSNGLVELLPEGHWANRGIEQSLTNDQPIFLTEMPFVEGVSSLVIVPLLYEQRMYHALVLFYFQKKNFTEDEKRLIKMVADMAVIALGRVGILESLERQVVDRTREITTLYELAEIAASSEDLRKGLDQSLHKVLTSVGGEAGTIHMLDDAGTKIEMIVCSGLSSEVKSELQAASIDDTFWRGVVERGEPVLQMDLQADDHAPPALQKSHLKSFIGAPIMARNKLLGIISIFHTSDHGPSLDEIGLLSMVSDQIGFAVDRAQLRAQARLAAIDRERQRLARELHDSVTQSLYSLSFIAKASRNFAREGQWDRVEEYLVTVQETAQQALKEMRLLVFELMPTSLEEMGLVDVLQQRLNFVERRSGVDTEVIAEGHFDLPMRFQVSMYRIAEEALNNILKHAGATQVVVRLCESGNRVEMEIEDNGAGFDPERIVGGMGIANMYERAETLNGELSIVSEFDKGTKVKLVISEVAT